MNYYLNCKQKVLDFGKMCLCTKYVIPFLKSQSDQPLKVYISMKKRHKAMASFIFNCTDVFKMFIDDV